jgi:hypothetical protein
MSYDGMKFRLGPGKPGESFIRRPITDDGLVGYDEFEQLMVCRIDKQGDKIFSSVFDVRNETCVLCDRGWEPTGPSIADQSVWQISRTHVHVTCLVRFGALGQRESYWLALVAARVRFGGLVPISNQYWPSSDPWAKQPWYYAELLDYPVKFVLGMRKRVHHVELRAQGGTELASLVAAEDVFKDEDVTKEFSPTKILLHAWSTEKMNEYVKRLVDLGGLAKELPR